MRTRTNNPTKRQSAHRTTPNVTLFELPKSIAVRAGLVHLAQSDVHKVVAVDEMAVECLAVFEFYELGRWVGVWNARSDCGTLTIGLFWAAVRSDSGSCGEAW